jgi:hypothetical protein
MVSESPSKGVTPPGSPGTGRRITLRSSEVICLKKRRNNDCTYQKNRQNLKNPERREFPLLITGYSAGEIPGFRPLISGISALEKTFFYKHEAPLLRQGVPHWGTGRMRRKQLGSAGNGRFFALDISIDYTV